MNKLSKKHHYLPRHFLKGFTDGRNGFFVYDKQSDRIFKTSPDATFFENDLNTVVFPSGKASSFLEDLYTDIENYSWRAIDNIRSSSYKNKISQLDKLHLFLFLLFLHWRLPSNISYIEKLSEGVFSGDGPLSFLKLSNKDGSEAPKEIADLLKNSSAFKKSLKLMIPFAPFYDIKNWIDGWQFSYTGDNGSWHIIGDNPIITKGVNDHDPMKCLDEFIFPVSGKVLLIKNSKLISKKELSRDFIIDCNIAILERARRFAACRNKDFLEAIVKLYKIHKTYGKTDIIIPELFRSLEI